MWFGSKQIEWTPSKEPFGRQSNMFRRAAIERLGSDGCVTFQDGWREESIDAVVFATGYKFSFPFLEASKLISVSDNRYGSPLWLLIKTATAQCLRSWGNSPV